MLRSLVGSEMCIRDRECADSEFNIIGENQNYGLFSHTTFDLSDTIASPYISSNTRPKVAVLREQGVNGHVEMAAAFTSAGFEAVDVHMSDLHSRRFHLKDFQTLVACGGFSYGDVLGAGGGWAKNILFTPHLKEQFEEFFYNKNTLALGVCNGCQMFAQLKSIIPNAEYVPKFTHNISEQFEARTVMVTIPKSDNLWLSDTVSYTHLTLPTICSV